MNPGGVDQLLHLGVTLQVGVADVMSEVEEEFSPEYLVPEDQMTSYS